MRRHGFDKHSCPVLLMAYCDVDRALCLFRDASEARGRFLTAHASMLAQVDALILQVCNGYVRCTLSARVWTAGDWCWQGCPRHVCLLRLSGCCQNCCSSGHILLRRLLLYHLMPLQQLDRQPQTVYSQVVASKLGCQPRPSSNCSSNWTHSELLSTKETMHDWLCTL
jgi:hypothetical protein